MQKIALRNIRRDANHALKEALKINRLLKMKNGGYRMMCKN